MAAISEPLPMAGIGRLDGSAETGSGQVRNRPAAGLVAVLRRAEDGE